MNVDLFEIFDIIDPKIQEYMNEGMRFSIEEGDEKKTIEYFAKALALYDIKTEFMKKYLDTTEES